MLYLKNQKKTDIFNDYYVRSEIIAKHFKSRRIEDSIELFKDVEYEYCPECGKKNINNMDKNICYLCKQSYEQEIKDIIPIDIKAINKEFDIRIYELNESISKHKDSYEHLKSDINLSKLEKKSLDDKYVEEMSRYDNLILSNTRKYENTISENNIKIINYKKMLEIPIKLDEMNKSLIDVEYKINEINMMIDEEKEEFNLSDKILAQIENEYLKILLELETPEIYATDLIKINKNTWVPEILKNGSYTNSWNFYDESSGGLKTILNVAYLATLHIVAKKFDLPLPEFIIMDTPTKNIGTDINEKIAQKISDLIYDLSRTLLKDTQFIIIDTDDLFPHVDNDSLEKRLMTRFDPDNKRLLTGYYVDDE